MHNHRLLLHSCSRRDLLKSGLAASAVFAVPASLLDGWRSMSERHAPDPVVGGPARPYLDAALKAERWIARSAIRSERGTSWPWDPTKPDAVQLNLYTGMPGVVLFYLELFHATGDRNALAQAVSGADYLVTSLPNDDKIDGAGFYTGLAGIAYTLQLTYVAGGETRHRDAARRALALVKKSAQPVGDGVEWSRSTDIISGSAGIGLFLLWAEARMGDADSRALAVAAGKALLARGQPERGGIKWTVSPDVPRNYPNFSHGTSGVSYFLASLGKVTGEKMFSDAAVAGSAYLDSLATTTPGGGRMVFHSEPGNEQLFYLSWCHGPAGTARLYHRLAEVTGTRAYRERVTQLAQAIVDMHVPDRSPGFWNNISQCCGNCGVTEFFIDLNRVTGDRRHMAFAEQIAADTLHRSTEDDGAMRWVQAENRVQPDVLIAQTGLMQGAAGVGIAMLHLDGVQNTRAPVVVLPDNPFAE